MRRRAAIWLMAVVAMLAAAPALAQHPSAPGPHVVDLRGATSSLSSKPGFYPPFPAATLIPGRAFGVEAGGHLYAGRIGFVRLGFGASVLRVRGTAPEVRALFTTVAPQLSFNFGTGAGWSYLSGGVGVGQIDTTATQSGVPDTHKSSGWRRSVNVGAGARWFIRPRLAVGFDIRLHKVARGSITPHASPLSASVGISLR